MSLLESLKCGTKGVFIYSTEFNLCSFLVESFMCFLIHMVYLVVLDNLITCLICQLTTWIQVDNFIDFGVKRKALAVGKKFSKKKKRKIKIKKAVRNNRKFVDVDHGCSSCLK